MKIHYLTCFFTFLLFIACKEKVTLFTQIPSSESGIHFNNNIVENDSINPLDLTNIYNGGGVGIGDFNNDGLQDVYFTGNMVSNKLYLNKGDFKFDDITEEAGVTGNGKWCRGVSVVDINNDGWLDIYVCATINNNPELRRNLLYINQGLEKNGIPHFKEMAREYGLGDTLYSTMAAFFDYDNDGDLDLFVAGRVYPWNYPKPVSCVIYRNDTKDGKIKFTDVTAEVAKPLLSIGMVSDAIWTDFDNDGWQDLVLAGEWMPIKFLKNDHGQFRDITSTSQIANQVGWWNSITAGDFDNDGDIDYVVSNLGENSFYKTSDKYPVSIYAKDFYNRGVVQCMLTSYIKDKQGGELKEFVTDARDDVISQLPFLKKRFLSYKNFGEATFDQLFTPKELEDATKYTANNFKSSFIRNNGNGTFTMEPLPDMAQYSAINGMITDDFDGDGNLDICMNTNDFGTVPSFGRYDALNGLMLKGDGKGKFTALNILQSGIFIPGNGKALVKLRGSNGKYLIAASQNKGSLKVFQLNKNCNFLSLHSDDVSAIIVYKDGRRQKRETGYGNSFLSQSARFITIDNTISSVEITNSKGKTRKVTP